METQDTQKPKELTPLDESHLLVNLLLILADHLHRYNTAQSATEANQVTQDIRNFVAREQLIERVKKFAAEPDFPSESFQVLCEPYQSHGQQIDRYETLYYYLYFFLSNIIKNFPQKFQHAFLDIRQDFQCTYEETLDDMLAIINGYYYGNYPKKIADIFQKIPEEMGAGKIVMFHELYFKFIELEYDAVFLAKKTMAQETKQVPKPLVPMPVELPKEIFLKKQIKEISTEIAKEAALHQELSDEIDDLQKTIGVFLHATPLQFFQITTSPKTNKARAIYEETYGQQNLCDMARQMTQGPSSDLLFFSPVDVKTVEHQGETKTINFDQADVTTLKQHYKILSEQLAAMCDREDSLREDISNLDQTVGVILEESPEQFEAMLALPRVQQAKTILQNKYGEEFLVDVAVQHSKPFTSEFAMESFPPEEVAQAQPMEEFTQAQTQVPAQAPAQPPDNSMLFNGQLSTNHLFSNSGFDQSDETPDFDNFKFDTKPW